MDESANGGERPVWRSVAIGFARYMAAWLAACLAATVLLFVLSTLHDVIRDPSRLEGDGAQRIVAESGLFIIGVGGLLILFTSWIWPILVGLARLANLPRGWADAGLAALMLLGVGARFYDVSAVMFALFTVAGAVAGLVFWLAAGRPRPPYRAPSPSP